MRSYGSDKPDRRIPPMHPVEDLLAGTAPTPACRWWRSTFPNTGAPSRKERDELKAFGQERGLRVYDDAEAPGARLSRARWRKVRERTGAGENDLLVLAAWAGEPKGHRPEETVYQACGQLRLYAAQKFNDRHKLLDPKNFQFLWVVDFPMFEWDEEENRWDGGAPSRSPRCTTRTWKS